MSWRDSFIPDEPPQSQAKESGTNWRESFRPDPQGPFERPAVGYQSEGAEDADIPVGQQVLGAARYTSKLSPVGAWAPRGTLEAAQTATGGILTGQGVGDSLRSARDVYQEERANTAPHESEALRRGAIQGVSLGLRDEAAGMLGALTGTLADKAKKVARGDFSGVTPQDMVSLYLHYQRAAEESRARDDAARAAHPKTFMLGEIGGGVAIPAGAAASGGSLAARLGRAALAGGATGAVQGFGASRGQTPEEVGSDAAVGGAIGAGVGAFGPALGTGASKLIDQLPESLKQKASEYALRAAGYIGNDFKRLIKNRGVQGAHQAGRELLDAGVIPPGGTVQDVLERIQTARPEAGRAVGEFIDQAAATGRQFDVAPVAGRVQSEIIDANSRSPAVRPMVDRVDRYLEELLDESMPGAGTVPFPLAQQWKTQGQGVLNYGNPWNNAGPNIQAQDMQKQLTRILKEEIDNQVEGALGPGSAQQFQAARRRYGALADAEDRAREGLARLSGNNKASQTDLNIGRLISDSAESIPGIGPLAVGGSRMVRQRADSTLARAADAVADAAASPAGTRFRELAMALAQSGVITPSAARAMVAEREAEEDRSRQETR